MRFKTLLDALGLDPVVADAWRDWVDADVEATGFGAEDATYLVATPPFRTANQPAGSTSEIGVAEPARRRSTRTSAAVCDGVADDRHSRSTSTRRARRHWNRCHRACRRRKRNRWYNPIATTTTSACCVAEVPELSDSVDAMAVVSSYFEIHARAEIDGYRTELTSEVYRDPTTGRITLLSRDFGKRLPSIVEAQERRRKRQRRTAESRRTDATVHSHCSVARATEPHELESLNGCCSTVRCTLVSQGSGDLRDARRAASI